MGRSPRDAAGADDAATPARSRAAADARSAAGGGGDVPRRWTAERPRERPRDRAVVRVGGHELAVFVRQPLRCARPRSVGGPALALPAAARAPRIVATPGI